MTENNQNKDEKKNVCSARDKNRGVSRKKMNVTNNIINMEGIVIEIWRGNVYLMDYN